MCTKCTMYTKYTMFTKYIMFTKYTKCTPALAECDTLYQSNLGGSPQLNLRILSRKEPLREGNDSLTTNGLCRLFSTRNS